MLFQCPSLFENSIHDGSKSGLTTKTIMETFAELYRLRQNNEQDDDSHCSSSSDEEVTFSYQALLEQHGEAMMKSVIGFSNEEFQELVTIAKESLTQTERRRKEMDPENPVGCRQLDITHQNTKENNEGHIQFDMFMVFRVIFYVEILFYHMFLVNVLKLFFR